MAVFQQCFTPNAIIWHNYDEIEQTVPEVSDALQLLADKSSRIEYKDQMIVSAGNTIFVQHVLTADLLDGTFLRLPAMMKIAVAADGRITRVEEYFDSRATDCLSSMKSDSGHP